MAKQVTVAGAREGIDVVFADSDITSIAVGRNILEQKFGYVTRGLQSVFPNSLNSIIELRVIGACPHFQNWYTFPDDGVQPFLPNLESVFLEHVKEIYEFSFFDCLHLASIRLPKSIEKIEGAVFASGAIDDLAPLSNLNTFIVESLKSWCSVDLGDQFSNPCYSAHSIIDEETSAPVVSLDSNNIDGASQIAPYTFITCQSLESINLPNSVASIGHDAFNGCTSLASAILPSTITAIGNDAFKGCTSLNLLSAPDGLNLSYLGTNVFQGCDSSIFDTITLPGFSLALGYIVAATTIPPELSLTSSSVKGVAVDVFTRNSNITSVVIGGGIINITDGNRIGSSNLIGAFLQCSNLTSVQILDGVERIGSAAFSGCPALSSVSLGANLKEIGEGAFSQDASLSAITFPNGLKIIGSYCFQETGLSSVDIPDSVEAIGSWAFADCNALTSVSIGTSLAEIPEGGFACCTALSEVTIPNNIKKIGDFAFEMYDEHGEPTENVLESVTIGEGLEKIGASAFQGCSSLKSLTFLGDAPEVGNNAFYGVPVGTTGCQVYVKEGTTGWGTVPGTWHGFNIKYIS